MKQLNKKDIYIMGIDPYDDNDTTSKSFIISKFRRCGDIKKTMLMFEYANNKQYYNDEWNQGNTNK